MNKKDSLPNVGGDSENLSNSFPLPVKEDRIITKKNRRMWVGECLFPEEKNAKFDFKLLHSIAPVKSFIL